MRMFFNIIFYKFYSFLKAEYNAMYFVVLLLTLNLSSIYGYCQCLINHSNNIAPPKLTTLSIAATLCVVGYFAFIHQKKYLVICQEVEESKIYKENRVGKVTLLYVLITLGILVGLIFLDCG